MKNFKQIGVLLLSLLLMCSIVSAASSRGIVTGDSEAIVIERSGQSFPCSKGELLYEGDILKGANVNSLAVEWHPYAKTQSISATEIKVVYQPPGAMDMAVYKLQEFFGFVDKEAQAQYAATRGGEKIQTEALIFPQPGFKATALTGYPITFAWGETKGRGLVIENNKKEIIFKKAITGISTLILKQEEIGMQPGEQYTWRIEGMYDKYKISLADNKVTKEIIAGLDIIDQGSGSAEEKLLNKAAYLQMISDDQAQSVDLYWLSYQFLQSINTVGNAELGGRVILLKNRFGQHLENTM